MDFECWLTGWWLAGWLLAAWVLFLVLFVGVGFNGGGSIRVRLLLVYNEVGVVKELHRLG